MRTHLTRAAAAAALVLAILAPLFLSPFRVTQLTQVLVTAVAVMGLNLLTGFTGQVSVGHSAFFGVGAYVSAVAAVEAGAGPLTGLVLAAVAGGCIGFAVGLPAQRIKGTHLALVTLILAAAFPAIVRRLERWTGGSQGLRGERLTAFEGVPLAVDQQRYYLVLSVLLAIGVGISILAKRPLGRAMRALGDHETAALAFGLRPRRRTQAPGLLGERRHHRGCRCAFRGDGRLSVAGHELRDGSRLGDDADGTGDRRPCHHRVGPILGAAVAELVPIQIGQQSPELAHLFYGALIIVVLIVLPGGLSSVPQLPPAPTPDLGARHLGNR